tara:strand:+ start:3429 stop:3884 length:456 start_codon:yes stop_codon:yes gene_type:complete
MLTFKNTSSVAKVAAIGVVLLLAGAQGALARNDKQLHPVSGVLSMPGVDSSVGMYFGNTPHPAVVKTLGTFPTNKKTNSFGKSDEEACNWAALSAVKTLQERALKEGGNAVINIKSYYKKNEVSHDDQFECHAGGFVAGVALIGDVVKLAK